MFNNHCHTDLSYCADGDMTLDFIAETVSNSPDLTGVAVTDHSFAIYFPSDVAWSWQYMTDSTVFDRFRDRGNKILEQHLHAICAKKSEHLIPGIETELMHDGRFTIDPEMLRKIDLIIGSVHWLDISDNATESEILKIWENYTLNLLDNNIHILGHPFRWLAERMSVDRKIIRRIVKKCVSCNVALELNSHFEIDTDIAMLQEAMEHNAKVAFSTDAHRRDEVNDFSYHCSVLEQMNISTEDLNIFIPATADFI